LILVTAIGALAAGLRWALRRREANRAGHHAGHRARRRASLLTGLLAAALTGRRAELLTGRRAGLLAGRRGERRGETLVEPASGDDFGLLRAAVLADDRASAETVRRLLAGAGIRSTVASGVDGRIRVLVFFDQVARARRVVGGPAERQE
jgi:hypothetical protein